MLRASIKSLLARKARLFMSAMAIILGTAFVAGTLIFTDTLGRTFDGIFEGTVGDVVIQPEQVDQYGGSTGARLSAAEVKNFADLPGAERADGNVEAMGVFVVGDNGNVVGGQGAPAMAFNYNDAPNQLGEEPIQVVDGRVPTTEGEVAVDEATLERGGHEVGDEITLVTAGDRPEITAKVVGSVTFGEGGTAGASITVFDTKTMQKYFTEGKDEYSTVWLTAKDGVDSAELLEQAKPLVPESYEGMTGAQLAQENEDSSQQALGFITTFLLVFAGIALFVGSFIIINTFSILVAQRGRELALLRAIGASRRQVVRSVLLEAFVVGVLGATLGLALGVLLAKGITALFASFGLDISSTGLVFSPRTAIAVYLVGIIITMLAAWLPAHRAGSIPPVAAMRDTAETTRGHPLRRALEVGVLVLGLLAFLFGLFVAESREIWWIGGGIIGLVLGTAFLSPFVGRPVIAGLGAIYRALFGSIGRMAQQNTVRSPGRTAATASALMIGMTLVALMGVVASSATASIDKQIEESFQADYILSNAIGQPFSSEVTRRTAEVEGVREVSPLRLVTAEVDGTQVPTVAIDPQSFASVEEIEPTQGSADLGKDTIMMSSNHAEGRDVGDTATITMGATSRDLEIVGFYDEIDALGNPPDVLLSIETVSDMGGQAADNWAFIFVDDGADKAAVQDGIEEVISGQPLVTLKDQAGYADEQRASIDQLLYVIYALLGLAIVIAVLGIVNTLGLSVMERTREIGLLRAVGLSRAQLRRMIRLESIAIALLGALLGIVLGVVAGVAIQRSLVEDGITELAIPWLQLIVFVVLAGVVGVLAAVVPAWRASRMNVLDAIAAE